MDKPIGKVYNRTTVKGDPYLLIITNNARRYVIYNGNFYEPKIMKKVKGK